MLLGENDAATIWLTIKLASLVTLCLLLISTPLAWWLSQTKSRLSTLIETIVALPIVLPPSVIGFYLLVSMGPTGPVGQLTQSLGLGTLPFTFQGLVVASIIYSLPFVVQPIQLAFKNIDVGYLEAAATLRASALDRFLSIALPLAKPGLLTGAILGFAHTVGEFGIVLMIGGNIPDETRVVSVQIYEYVETLEYDKAHRLSALMLAFSFVTLLALYAFNPNKQKGQ